MGAWRTAASACVLVLLSGVAACGQDSYWGEWQKHPEQSYYSRNFYFQVAGVDGYKHHRCIWVPGQKWLYYYNPYTRKVWGRCSAAAPAKRPYYKLEKEQQISINHSANVIINLGNNNTNQIFDGVPGGDFAQPGVPGVPNANGPTMGPPPDDPPLGLAFPEP